MGRAGLGLSIEVAHDLVAFADRTGARIRRGAMRGAKRFEARAKLEYRQDVRRAGLGDRLANTWRTRVYPLRGESWHPALANGVSQAAVYARFAAFLERNMGLVGNAADDVDYALAANNSLFVDAVTRTIYQWRSGVLEPVFSVGLQFNPKGAWSNVVTYARNDMVVDAGKAFVSNADSNLNHQPPSSSDGDAWWTRLPIAPMAPIEVGAIDTTHDAAISVSGHRAIALLSDGRVRHADPTDIADAHRVIGVSLNAAVANDLVKVRRFGDVTDASLSFTAGAPVFVGASGVLTQAPPTAPGSAFLLRIGAATAVNVLHVNPSPPLAF